MKKFILGVLLVLFLTACSSDEIKEIEFNDHVYTLEEVSTDGYDMFVYDTFLVEVYYASEDDSFIITTEMDGDIYIVLGTIDEYTISKNGSTIMIDGADLIATGSEYVNWNDDIIPIMEQYVK